MKQMAQRPRPLLERRPSYVPPGTWSMIDGNDKLCRMSGFQSVLSM